MIGGARGRPGARDGFDVPGRRINAPNAAIVAIGDQLYVTDGGLVSYGPVFLDQFSRAAEYVDRILKGANPGDLPVQAPVRFEIALNLKTAKALGLDVPRIVLSRADHVFD